MSNNSGKALTIFLVLIAVILISLTAISVFLLIKQVQLRESAEYHLAQIKTSESALRVEFDEVKKQKEILEQKTQEAESKIESLLEELDLAEGVRDEVKKENRELKDSLEALTKTNKEIDAKLTEKEQEVEMRVGELQEQLNVALERNKTLEEKRHDLEREYETLKAKLSDYGAAASGEVEGDEGNVNLEKIVVSSEGLDQGNVVSVDQEAEFVIVNLGERHGIIVDSELSIYDGEKYLGDIIVTKVLPEMAAADFISPLTSRDVSEGNLVKIK